ncbi:MAG: purine-nucleoside phosphorylase [Acidimicrobiia bacterium]|nr:purine-nucleoside phosphorylase [Acidimicrobiia bacterium]MYB75025.1 purine-nucleoside phosphorylase [Acidimicrobiia bacterium]MYH99948.1 purine-nucleoside phosphorylase [Acidimicrobiia bacterium]
MNPFERAEQAGAQLIEQLGGHFDAAVVLGSGWAEVAQGLGTVDAAVAAESITGFHPPSVPGHGGTLSAVNVADRRVLVMAGRVHLYEGHPPAEVVHGVRAAVAAGCSTVVLTNAAGCMNPAFGVGQPVLISDHINLTGLSPLFGPAPPEGYDIRFTDLTDLYSLRIREAVRVIDPSVGEGVYAGLVGPHFETPAEITMLARMGADLVGMSTVLEAIAVRHLGAEVAGVSLVTNAAAGMGGELDHQEVLDAGQAAQGRVTEVLSTVIKVL